MLWAMLREVGVEWSGIELVAMVDGLPVTLVDGSASETVSKVEDGVALSCVCAGFADSAVEDVDS